MPLDPFENDLKKKKNGIRGGGGFLSVIFAYLDDEKVFFFLHDLLSGRARFYCLIFFYEDVREIFRSIRFSKATRRSFEKSGFDELEIFYNLKF